MDNLDFTAPTLELEKFIVNTCVDDLELTFGEFWYKWFDTNGNNNHVVHVECNEPNLSDKIKNILLTNEHIDKVFRVEQVNLPRYCEFKYQYYIHFKHKNLKL